MGKSLPDVLTLAHHLTARAVETGSVVVDATVGNGHDTLFLAQQVGRDGHVYGFDVQETALQRTRNRLVSRRQAEQVTLHNVGHEVMRKHLPTEAHGRVSAVMFNLGYLPNSSSDCITQPETTVAALEDTARVLQPGGIATIVLYTGHEGGCAEADAVEAWVQALDHHDLQAHSYSPMNLPNDPPRLIVLEQQ